MTLRVRIKGEPMEYLIDPTDQRILKQCLVGLHQLRVQLQGKRVEVLIEVGSSFMEIIRQILNESMPFDQLPQRQKDETLFSLSEIYYGPGWTEHFTRTMKLKTGFNVSFD